MNAYYDYLFSNAYIETAVSKLLETQAKKIHILSEKGLPAEQIGELNKTLKDQLKKLECLQLLLYNKTALLLKALENGEIAAEKGFTHGCVNTHKNTCGYILNCKSQNAVGNPHDPYSGGYSVLDAYAFIPNAKKGGFLSYNVIKGSKMLDLFSRPADMQPEISFDSDHVRVKIKGTGLAMIENGKHDRFRTCGYVLEVVSDDMSLTHTACSIKIFTADEGILTHNSGMMECAASLAKA